MAPSALSMPVASLLMMAAAGGRAPTPPPAPVAAEPGTSPDGVDAARGAMPLRPPRAPPLPAVAADLAPPTPAL